MLAIWREATVEPTHAVCLNPTEVHDSPTGVRQIAGRPSSQGLGQNLMLRRKLTAAFAVKNSNLLFRIKHLAPPDDRRLGQ